MGRYQSIAKWLLGLYNVCHVHKIEYDVALKKMRTLWIDKDFQDILLSWKGKLQNSAYLIIPFMLQNRKTEVYVFACI